MAKTLSSVCSHMLRPIQRSVRCLVMATVRQLDSARRHGFNSFLTPSARSPRKSIDHFKPHQCFCQYLHGPPNAAFRRNRTGHLNQTRFLLPVQDSSAPKATVEACAPEPSSDPAPPPADAHVGRPAPPPPAYPPPARPSVPDQQPPDPRPAESVHAAVSSPIPHDACSTSAPIPTHPAHPAR